MSSSFMVESRPGGIMEMGDGSIDLMVLTFSVVVVLGFIMSVVTR